MVNRWEEGERCFSGSLNVGDQSRIVSVCGSSVDNAMGRRGDSNYIGVHLVYLKGWLQLDILELEKIATKVSLMVAPLVNVVVVDACLQVILVQQDKSYLDARNMLVMS